MERRPDDKQPSRLVFDASTQVSPFSAVTSPLFQPPDGKAFVERHSPAFSGNQRYSRSLDQALTSLQQSDGAREARTLLPGIDLRSTLGIAEPTPAGSRLASHASSEQLQTDDAALQVIQAPRGIDLREAVLQALSLDRDATLRASLEELPSSPVSVSTATNNADDQSRNAQEEIDTDDDSSFQRAQRLAWKRLVSKLGKEDEDMSQSLHGQAEGGTRSALPSTPPSKTSANRPVFQIDIPVVQDTTLRDEGSKLPTAISLAPSPQQSPEERAACACRLWPILAPFTPRMLRDGILCMEHGFTERNASSVKYANQHGKPVAECFFAAVAIADVSGFTALTELLSKQGPDGVEILTRCMNSYFAQVIDLVLNHGGDISKFAGDAMLIVFKPTRKEIENDDQSSGGLAPATRRAARCMKEMIDRFGVMGITSSLGDVCPVPRDDAIVKQSSSDRVRVWGVDGVMKKVGSGRRMLMQLGEELQKLPRLTDERGLERVTHVLPRHPFKRSSFMNLPGLKGSRRVSSTGRLNVLETLPDTEKSVCTEKGAEEDHSIADHTGSIIHTQEQASNINRDSFQQRFLASLTEEFESGRRSVRPPELPGTSMEISTQGQSSLSKIHPARQYDSSPDLLAVEKRRLSSLTEREKSFSKFSHSTSSFSGRPPSLNPSLPEKSNKKPSAFKPSDTLLSLKVTLGAGEVCAFRVGGICESTALGVQDAPRWEFFIADAKVDSGPIAQLTAIEQYAVPGRVVLSANVNALLEGFATVDSSEQEWYVLKSMVNEDHRCADRVAYERENKDSSMLRHHQEMFHLGSLSPDQKVAAYQTLRSHVPLNIRNRVEAGHLDFVNEVRVCTILFFGFPFLKDKDKGGLDAVQRVARVVQERMVLDDGFFLQMRCDEKGYLALCAFGLPGRAHEDSPARGLRAAVSVLNTLQGGLAGVTTGDCFCAVVGSQARAEYTVFGDAINLAARLVSSRASSGSGTAVGAVWCDEPTRWLVAGRGDEFLFRSLGPMQVKGKSGATKAFIVQKKSLVLVGNEGGIGREADLRNLKASQMSEQVESHSGGDTNTENDNRKDEKIGSGYSSDMMTEESPDGEPTSSVVAFVGRETELSEFASRIKALVDGAGGSTVLVVGEAGVGKTRLAEEVAAGEGLGPLRARCTVVSGVARSLRQSEPLFPWRRVFRQLFSIDREHKANYEHKTVTVMESDDPRSGPTPLEARLRGRVREYGAWRATLAGALGLSPDDMPAAWKYEESDITPFFDRANRNSPPASSTFVNRSGRSRYGRSLVDMPRARSVAVGQLQLRYSLLDNNPEVSPSGSLVSRSLSARTLVPDADEVSALSSRANKSNSGHHHHHHHSSSGHIGSGHHHHHHHPPLSEMSVSLRAEKVRSLLVTLICEFMAVYGPVIIVMDDIHLFDGASWRLILAIMDSCVQDGVLIVATAREQKIHSTMAPYAHYYQRMVKHCTTLQMHLERFTLEETDLFVFNALEGVPVPHATVRLLWEKSAGLAAYLHQMMLFLKLLGSSPRSSQGATTMELAHLGMEFVRATVNIHAIVAARMDRLPPEEQLTVKVASIMGMVVYADLLLAIHPLSPSKARLEASLQALSQGESQFLIRSWDGSDSNGTTWRFEDVLARDVVYNMIPLSQRSTWHSKLAYELETYKDGRGNSIPPAIIAYHWSQAAAMSSGDAKSADGRTEASLKAVRAWEKAALEASLSWSYDGEITLLNHARASAEGAGDAVPHWRKAGWERCTAAALFYTEMEAENGGADVVHPACVHCLRALDLLDVPMPWSAAYKNSAKFGPLTRHVGRKIGAVIKHLWTRKKGRIVDTDMSFAPDLTSLARPNIDDDNDHCAGQKESTEREKEAALTVLTAALLLKGKSVADSESNCRYVLWVCDNSLASSSSVKTVRAWIKSALNRARKSVLLSSGAIVLERLEKEVGGAGGGPISTATS